MDIGDGSSVELMDEFCYFGDTLSVDGDADGTARICSHWSNSRSLASFLMAKKCFLLL